MSGCLSRFSARERAIAVTSLFADDALQRLAKQYAGGSISLGDFVYHLAAPVK
jgi:hypothetical protein